MTTEQLKRISVIDPLDPAFERVKIILFKPFDLGKWFVIGFCAWLAYLGSGGGGGGGGGRGDGRAHWDINDVRHQIGEAKGFFLENMFWIIPVAIIVMLVILCLWILFTWLSSKGRFMFLHCVAENKAEVKVPWAKFREHTGSLFLFRIVVGLVAFAIFGLPLIIVAFSLIAMLAGPTFIMVVPGIIAAALVFLLLGIIFWLIHRFTMDFVVPIMFLRTTSCTAAWREFLSLLSMNKARFTLYAFFRIIIGIAIVFIIFLGFCIGCCCCCLSVFLLIPYISTVILLPVYVFERSYSLYYIRQYGPQFDVFNLAAAEEVPQ
jgi:hypothetical protein